MCACKGVCHNTTGERLTNSILKRGLVAFVASPVLPQHQMVKPYVESPLNVCFTTCPLL
jgi:hypothetical protein